MLKEKNATSKFGGPVFGKKGGFQKKTRRETETKHVTIELKLRRKRGKRGST